MDMDKKHPIVRTAIWEQLGLLKEHLQYILKINGACKSLHYVIDLVGPGGGMITLEKTRHRILHSPCIDVKCKGPEMKNSIFPA